MRKCVYNSKALSWRIANISNHKTLSHLARCYLRNHIKCVVHSACVEGILTYIKVSHWPEARASCISCGMHAQCYFSKCTRWASSSSLLCKWGETDESHMRSTENTLCPCWRDGWVLAKVADAGLLKHLLVHPDALQRPLSSPSRGISISPGHFETMKGTENEGWHGFLTYAHRGCMTCGRANSYHAKTMTFKAGFIIWNIVFAFLFTCAQGTCCFLMLWWGWGLASVGMQNDARILGVFNAGHCRAFQLARIWRCTCVQIQICVLARMFKQTNLLLHHRTFMR